MITNFEEITVELSEDELKLIPILIDGFNKRTKENPIKAPEIVKKMKSYLESKQMKISFNEVRLRKCVNYIRSNSLMPLIATSEGYYISNDKEEIEKQIKSLQERARSIAMCANGLQKLIS